MTQEKKEKLRNVLVKNKNIVDYNESNSFVSIYFDDLCNVIDKL